MKIDRRSFLSLVAGGAVGTALTPLPIKLMDDVSIWSQNFRYLPIEVPVPPDGAASYKDTVCTLCPGGCGLSVRKIGNRAVKIEGQPEHPVNRGSVCALGLTGLQLLYGPWRVQKPLKKENGQWKTISWDIALDEIAEKIRQLRNTGKAHTIAGILPEQKNITAHLLQRFLAACGSPNVLAVPAQDDAQQLAVKNLLGRAAPLGFDFENSSFVVSFSSGLLDGWGSPVRMLKAHSRWKEKGATLVQVEPRLSNTAAKADQWIPIYPGTEADLALGMAQIIIRDYLHDRHITEAGHGFARLQELLNKDYTSAKVAAKTRIDEPTIEKLARRFAKAANPVAVCGRGNGRQPVSGREAMAVLTLNILVGALNRRGGISTQPAPGDMPWADPVLDTIARQGLTAKGLDGTGVHRLPEMINRKGEAAISALFVVESNPAYTLHNATAVQEALAQVPLLVSLSAYLDETAALADYVLPLPTPLERKEDVRVTAGLKNPLVALSRPVVKPLANTRHPGDIIIDLARKTGVSVAASFPWKDYDDCLQRSLGDKWRTLSRQGYWQQADTRPNPAIPAVDFMPLVVAATKPAPTLQGDKSFPLVLVPYDSMRLAEDSLGTPPFALKTISDDVIRKKEVLVAVNPDTARQYNLSEGERVTLATPAGKARVKVHLSHGIAPEIVAMPRGLGHTAYDDYLAGKGVNTNELIAPVEDPVTGLDVAWGVRAKFA